MLRIRPEQVRALSQAQLKRFEDEALRHVLANWPEPAAEQGEEGVRQTIARALVETEEHGIQTEYDILRYLNLMYALGLDFSTEQAWAQEVLAQTSRPARNRLDDLTERALELEQDGGDEHGR